jgi:hypothetical protein
MQKFWETMWNCESEDGSWEIIVDEETKTVKLEFWDYADQGTEDEHLRMKSELVMSFDQYQSLLDFSKRMNKPVWNSVVK